MSKHPLNGYRWEFISTSVYGMNGCKLFYREKYIGQIHDPELAQKIVDLLNEKEAK